MDYVKYWCIILNIIIARVSNFDSNQKFKFQFKSKLRALGNFLLPNVMEALSGIGIGLSINFGYHVLKIVNVRDGTMSLINDGF